MSVLLIGALVGGLGLVYLAARAVVHRRRIRVSMKRARGSLPPAAERAQNDVRLLLGRADVLIVATKKTSFQPSAEVIEIAMIDTTGSVRLDQAMLPTGAVTREATAAHGIDRDELQRLRAPHYYDVHDRIATVLSAAKVVLAYDAPLEKRGLYRTAASHELALPEHDWRCVRIDYSEYACVPADKEEGLRRWTLAQAARREGIPVGKPHLRALGDCRTIHSLLEAVTGTGDARRRRRS